MSARLPVNKTYKLFIGGEFPRTESGRFYEVSSGGSFIGNICLASRKDARDAVVSARNAFAGWSGKTAYNRGQIVYRIAEMLEGRKAQFVEELMLSGTAKKPVTKKQASDEVDCSIDRLIHFAGWSDKYQQLFSAVNPVASKHFDFSMPIPTGVVAVIAPSNQPLLGLVSVVIPAMVGGNTIVVLASEESPIPACTFAEVLHSSDVPGGVINILTGTSEELLPHLAVHMDINALIYCRDDVAEIKIAEEGAATNVKRVAVKSDIDWSEPANGESPYLILDTQEIQTTWHPIGI